jgi:hypothetical protein
MEADRQLVKTSGHDVLLILYLAAKARGVQVGFPEYSRGHAYLFCKREVSDGIMREAEQITRDYERGKRRLLMEVLRKHGMAVPEELAEAAKG